MSRKGVTTKRVKTVQTALSRISAQTAQSGWPRNECSARPNHIRPSEVSAKVPNRPADHASRPGKHCPRSATHNRHATPRTTMPREPGNKASRPRNHSRTTADASVRAGKRPTSGREPSAKSHPSDHAGRPRIIRPRPFRLGHDPIVRPIVPTDRPNAAVDPKPVLKPKLHIFKARLNPKPPLERPSTIYIAF
ncbi:unnamed protein product [Microthlaspi erraticum]|uniref:Uncharacterized protein n=1 Tax=Microthlaspi erraticum TaxID=1685480 RepID=A0A6D2JL73_9BRAS|nr:unnamed protein product [Microthlaspi erraticum]